MRLEVSVVLWCGVVRGFQEILRKEESKQTGKEEGGIFESALWVA